MPRSSDSGFSSSEAAAMLQVVASAAECRWSVGCPRAAFGSSRSGQSGGKLAAARAGRLPAAAMENGLAASLSHAARQRIIKKWKRLQRKELSKIKKKFAELESLNKTKLEDDNDVLRKKLAKTIK